MNKNSKYSKLLEDTQDKICRAEIGVTGVFQLMLETLDQIERESANIGPKLEWTLMTDNEPSGNQDHVDCYVVLKRYPKHIEEYPWNTHHKCFDGKDYDDYAYSPEDILCWIIKPELDLPSPPSS